MSINRGKDFETHFKECWEKLSNSTTIDRLHDQTTGFAGSKNICDFIAYKYPNIFYLELKSVHGNTLPFSNITDTQWNGLLEKAKVYGVYAGIVVWYVDKDVTQYFHIEKLTYLRDKVGNKSVRFDDESGIEISGKKKRVFFDYDINKFLYEVTQ